MDAFDFSLIIFFLVILLLIVAIYAYLLWLNLKGIKQRFASLRKDTDALDLQVEAFKLLIKKYRSSFPPTILEEVEDECIMAREKADKAVSQKELFEAKFAERRWQVLLLWLQNNL